MAAITLEQFRDAKLRGFPGWETTVTFGYESATPCVDPVDARFGAPICPLSTDPETIGPAFQRWRVDTLAGDHFVSAAAASGALVYCQLERDAGLVRHSCCVPPVATGGAEPEAMEGSR